MVCAGNGQLPEGDGGGARGEAGLGREGNGGAPGGIFTELPEERWRYLYAAKVDGPCGSSSNEAIPRADDRGSSLE